MGRSRQKKTKLQWWQWCDRRRKNQPPPETLLPSGAEISDGGPTRFFGCYLLTSLSPRFKGHSYIGFTVNPKRRIRQHNGEITSGASKTKRKRPWEMVFCIHGFPSQVAALQFEWAWQHPKESLAVREAASSFKSLGGLANKIKLSLTMLTLPSWKSMDLTVSFFSTKYMNHTAGCPTLPAQMKLHFCPMDELPCYWRGDRPYACDDQDDIGSNHTQDFDTEEISSQVVIESIHGIDNFDQFDLSCQKESPSPRHFHAGFLSKETWTEEEQRDPSPDLTERSKGDSNHIEEISSPVLIESIHGIYSFEKESSSSHPFDQNDPSCQKESPSPRHFHAGILSKETWTEEEQRDPSPDLTERSKGDSNHIEEISSPVLIESIHGIYSFEKESSSSHTFDQFNPSCLKESPSPRHFHAGILSKETWTEEEQRDPSPDLTERSKGDSNHIEEISSPVLIESIHGIYSFEKESSSSHPFDQNDPSCQKESPSHRVLEEDIDIVIDKSAKKDDITHARLPVRVRGDVVWPSSMEGIEIIDLFTPSPECRLVSCSKKRRVIRDSTDIIDLTRSPLFVQL